MISNGQVLDDEIADEEYEEDKQEHSTTSNVRRNGSYGQDLL